MLRQRILTALVLVPLVVGGVLGLGTQPLALLLAAVILLAGWEWASLVDSARTSARVAYLVLLGLVLFGTALAWQAHGVPAAIRWTLAPALLGWVIAGGWVVAYQRSAGHRPAAPGPWTLRIVGLLVLVPPWLALVTVHGSGPEGPWLVLFLLVLIWTADSGAYFAGRRFGRHKLASRVSPGKSLEGVAGALLLGSLFTLAAGVGLGIAGRTLGLFLLLGVATVLVSVLGDLFESLVKRYRDVKDSGGLLPGHGGVLDRIDSLTAAAPFFAVGQFWILGA
ncbi:MAG: phosphatidate cytidylyltransferase [Gammaproteobacteria bacterium]|nr:phosphatidate cytidylyltransferase [Gammaproteobacteria bacterium]